MVFLFIYILIITIILTIFFSNIQVEVNSFKFSSITQNHIDKDYSILIKWRVFSKILLMKLEITKPKLDKINIKKRMKDINLEKLKKSDIIAEKGINSFKKLNICIEKINLNIDIGTENAMITAIIVPIISTIISGVINQKIKDYNSAKFMVNPLYINKNIINIAFSGIFELKIRNIIYIIMYILNKKEGVKKYERTSNRGTYDYSYE